MLDLIVIVDPFPSMASVMSDKDNTYILAGCSQYETSGSVTSTSRQIQWRHKVVDPIYDSKDDYTIMAELVKRLGFVAPG